MEPNYQDPQNQLTPEVPQTISGYTPQPVAYDQEGKPLYSQPHFVHLTRAVQPIEEHISREVLQLHEQSQKLYPHLNLTRGEYIISTITRHPVGLFKIWSIGLMLIGAFMILYIVLFSDSNSSLADMAGIGAAMLGVVFILTVIGTIAATYVYNSSRFFLTNESVIQEIQQSLFSKHEQTVSLLNVEDASFMQGGIFSLLFNYGTIRLSTEGDETTYRFTYVSNPKKQIAILNNAVEAFKNGRPVGLPLGGQISIATDL